MEEWHNFNTAKLVSLEFQKSGCSEQLAAFSWKQCGDINELIVVDSFGLVVWLRQIIFKQVPQLFQIFFLQHFCGLVLQEPGARLLAYSEEQRIVSLRLLVIKFWDLFKTRICTLLEFLFLF